jgi:septal ring factor EnvC (AmiA/AmiB activator)
MRVERLETWAGPGQAEALAAGVRDIRADIADMRRVQSQHTVKLTTLQSDVAELKSDVAELKSDVAELKSDVAELKSDVAEILRRLPPPPDVALIDSN